MSDTDLSKSQILNYLIFKITLWYRWASQVVLVVNNQPANAGDAETWVDPWVRNIPWRRAWQPTPVFLSGECYGQRSLAGYSPWGRKESDTTEATQHCIALHDVGNIIIPMLQVRKLSVREAKIFIFTQLVRILTQAMWLITVCSSTALW